MQSLKQEYFQTEFFFLGSYHPLRNLSIMEYVSVICRDDCGRRTFTWGHILANTFVFCKLVVQGTHCSVTILKAIWKPYTYSDILNLALK